LVFGAADINGAIGIAIQKGDKELAEQNYLFLKEHLGEVLLEFNPVDILYAWDPKIGFRTIKSNDVILEGNLGKSYNQFLTYLVDKYQAKAIPVTGASFIDPNDKLVQDCLSKNTFK